MVGCANNLISIKIEYDILFFCNSNSTTDNINCLIVNHHDGGLCAVSGNSVYGCLECHILGLTDLCHIMWVANGEVAFHVCGGNTYFTFNNKLLWNFFIEIASGDDNLACC